MSVKCDCQLSDSSENPRTIDLLSKRVAILESALLDAAVPLTLVARHPSAIGRMPVVQESAARALTLIQDVLEYEDK